MIRSLLTALAAALFLAAGTSPGHAATASWDGGGSDAAWTNSDNWVADTPPAGGDDVVFDNNAVSQLATVLGQDFSVNQLEVADPVGAVSVSGNTLTLGAGGIAMTGATQPLTVNSAVILDASQTWEVGGGGLVVDGSISNPGHTLTVSNTVAVTCQGGISGSGNLTKTGSGTQTLSGQSTYSGWTTVSEGTLKFDETGEIPNSQTISLAPGATLDAVDVLTGFILANGQSLQGSGTLGGLVEAQDAVRILPGGNHAAGTLTITGDTILSSDMTNYFDLAAAGTVGSGVNDLVDIGGDLYGEGAAIAVQFLEPPGAGSYRLFNCGILQSGFDTSVRHGTRYTLAVDEGTAGEVNLTVSGSNADLRWDSTSDTTWDVGMASNWYDLGITAGDQVFYNTDTVRFDDTPGVATTVNIPAATTVAPASMTVDASANQFTIGGAGGLGGAGHITKLGSSVLTLGGANTFGGDVHVSNGTLKVTSATALGSPAGGTYVSSGSALNLNSQSIGKEPIYVSGSGVGGSGALYSTGPALTGRGTGTPGWIKLLGDTVISASPNSWEFGRDSANAIFNCNGYHLTKIGPDIVWVAECTVANMAGVTIAAGSNLGFKDINNSAAAMTGEVTVAGGASLHLDSEDAVQDIYPMPVIVSNGFILARPGGAEPNLTGTINLMGALNRFGSLGGGYVGGTIGGTGKLVKADAGWWSLTGTNTYTGGTRVDAGTLYLGYPGQAGGSVVGDIALNGGSLNYAHGVPVTVSNNISGTGALVSGVGPGLTFDGSATVAIDSYVRVGDGAYGKVLFRPGCQVQAFGLLLGDDYDGDVVMDGGSVDLTGPSANNVLRIGLNSGYAGSLRMQGGLMTVSNSTLAVGWDGAGTLYMEGGEIQALRLRVNANTAAGGGILVVEGGRITLGAAGFSLPAGPNSTFLGGGTFGASEDWTWNADQAGYLTGSNGHFTVDSSGHEITIAGALSGPGGLNKVGSGSLVLEKASTYDGPTTVSEGVLEVYGGHTGTGAWTVESGGTLHGTGTVAGAISVEDGGYIGAGSSGRPGTLNAAGLDLSNGATIRAYVGGGVPTLNITGNNGFMTAVGATNLIEFAGLGPLSLGSEVLFNYVGTLSNMTFVAGRLPSLAQGFLSNNLANTSIDLVVTTTVGPGLRWSGATDDQWDVESTDNWRDTNGNPATFFQYDPVVFDDTADTFVATVAETVLPVSVVVSNDLNAYTLAGSGAIEGETGLAKLGTNLLLVVNPNTYLGVTEVREGILQVGSGGTSGSLGSGPVTNDASLVYNRSDTVTANLISGTGSVTKDGSGQLTMADDQLYTGGTVLNDGTLQLGNNDTAGMLGPGPLAMADGSTLMIDRSDSITISNALSGAGTIIKRRANTVTYSGVSTFAGTLREDSGTFTVAPGASITGLSVLLQDFNAAGTWNIDGVLSADTYQYGAWVALNNNTRTVTLNVNDGGTATFGSMFLSKIGWANNATAITIINVNAGGTMTATSVMGLVNHPNAGGFRRPHRYINVNGGRLNVSEIDLSQGGDAGTDRRLTIDDGTVANITNGNLTVDSSTEVRLLNSATVEASAGRTITFSGVVYDTGSLTKTGPGTLALQGTNTYSGSTMVSNGTLLVEGSLSNGTVYVATGGTLGGGGTVHGDTDSDGTVAPGSSAGQLTLDANYTQAAAGTLAIELGGLQPVTEHDRLVVGGTAGLDGQLAVSFIDGFEGSVVIGNVFTVMQAGVISGEFANAPEGSVLAAGGWGVRVNYTANDVVLTVEEEPGGDDDSDGIPNDWELQYSGTTTGVVADADQDGDGILGLDEYILDYDPINTTNLWFAIREMNMGSVDVVFGDTTNSRLYTVDYSSNLASEVWTVLQGPDAGSNGVTTVTDPSEEPLRGYRIRVQTP